MFFVIVNFPKHIDTINMASPFCVLRVEMHLRPLILFYLSKQQRPR